MHRVSSQKASENIYLYREVHLRAKNLVCLDSGPESKIGLAPTDLWKFLVQVERLSLSTARAYALLFN